MTGANDLDVATVIEALEALGDGIAIFGPDERSIFSNRVSRERFATLYGLMDSGLTYSEGIHAAVRKGMAGATEEAIHAFASDMLEKFHTGCTYVTRSDSGRAIQVSFRPMSGGRKAAISVDITDHIMRERELDKARKAAEAASASKSSFLANMSHEIRTPLNGIMGMAQVLDQTSLDDQQREFLAVITESSKTLMAVLNDVLDLSKIEAGKFDIVATDKNIRHVMRRQLALWRPRAEEKGLELNLSFDADLPAWLSFDAVRVQQCVSNLLSNAIKFTETGRVEAMVSARELENGAHLVKVSVRDTGPGMDEATLGRLFKPFAQADETTQRVHGGTGLGLSITRKLAELMGGSAWADSEPGRGSTFHLTFRGDPAQASNMAGASSGAPSETGVRDALKSSNLRILLVDDHPINRQVASLFLRPFNMRVVEAVNGAEALDALGRETFDVVLMDMHMPVMDGPTAVSRIRSSGEPWAGVKIIALTADAMSGDRERYLGMGMDGYLSKPLAERDLLTEIARVRSGEAAADERLALSA